MVTLAVVGVGGWGKNLARNYFQIPECELRYICEKDTSKLEQLQTQLPGTGTCTRFEDILEDSEVQALVIATPAPSHFMLCKAALEAGKDIYVEKPFVLNVDEAEVLIKLAEQNSRILMVGHLLEYHPIITRLKQMVDADELGNIYYICLLYTSDAADDTQFV